MTQKPDLNYTVVCSSEQSRICPVPVTGNNTIFSPDCHLEFICLEFFRRYHNGICLWLYFSLPICLLIFICALDVCRAPVCFACCCCSSGLCWKMFWSKTVFYLLMLQWVRTLAGQFAFVALQY